MLVSKERYQGLEVEHYANIEPKAQCTEDYINVKQDELDLGLAWACPGPAPPMPRGPTSLHFEMNTKDLFLNFNS